MDKNAIALHMMQLFESILLQSPGEIVPELIKKTRDSQML